MLFGLQLLDEGLELLVPDLRIERVAHLGADHALLVDDEGLGNARDAEVKTDPVLHLEDDHVVRIALLAQHVEGGAGIVLVDEANDRGLEAVLLELDHVGVLLLAGNAPRGPDVEHPDLALHLLGGERLRGVEERRERPLRHRLVDEHAGQLSRIHVEPLEEEAREDNEDSEGNQILERLAHDLFSVSFVLLLAAAVASVGRGPKASGGHDDAAPPDPGDVRLVVGAHDPAAVIGRRAEAHVHVARDRVADGGLGHRHRV